MLLICLAPPPPLVQPADGRAVHSLPPSHLVPLPLGGPAKKKKKKRIQASLLPSAESPTPAARPSLASPSMGNELYGHQPPGSSRSRSEPSPHRESPGFRSFQHDLGRPNERPASRSQSDQWHRLLFQSLYRQVLLLVTLVSRGFLYQVERPRSI